MEDEGLIARNVRLRMESKGLSRKSLSLKAGLNETYVRDILTGRSSNPRQGHLQKLALALECRVSDLTGEIESGQNMPGRSDDVKVALHTAIDEMSDEKRRALLILITRNETTAPPEDASPGPPPKRRAVGCEVPVARMSRRQGE